MCQQRSPSSTGHLIKLILQIVFSRVTNTASHPTVFDVRSSLSGEDFAHTISQLFQALCSINAEEMFLLDSHEDGRREYKITRASHDCASGREKNVRQSVT